MSVMKQLIFWGLLLGGQWGAQANAFLSEELQSALAQVDSMEIADINADGNDDIVLVGRTEERANQLQLIALNQGKAMADKADIHPLSEQLIMYDVGQLADVRGQSLVFIQPGKVVAYMPNERRYRTLVDVKSIYRDSFRRTSAIAKMDFLQDVNQDGLSDIIVADFEQTRIFIQRSDGGFSEGQSVNIPAHIRIFRNNNAVYRGLLPQLSDRNFDGTLDLVYRIKSELWVFFQRQGHFAREPHIETLQLAAPLNDEYDEFRKDQSNLVTHRFHKLTDLDNDGILDVITQQTRSEGMLDKSSEYHFYFGKKSGHACGCCEKCTKPTVVYGKKPDSVIGSEGLQFELALTDFDGDNRMDLVSPSYDLGVGSIIASLFSSSADLDIAFHGFKQDNGYARKPNLSRELTVEFDLSSGQQVYPLLKVADFNGDGISDLLKGNGIKRLELHVGVNSDKLFVRKSTKIKVPLPKDGRMVAVKDLNGDGKADLVIRYDRLDGKERSKQLRVMLAG